MPYQWLKSRAFMPGINSSNSVMHNYQTLYYWWKLNYLMITTWVDIHPPVTCLLAKYCKTGEFSIWLIFNQKASTEVIKQKILHKLNKHNITGLYYSCYSFNCLDWVLLSDEGFCFLKILYGELFVGKSYISYSR